MIDMHLHVLPAIDDGAKDMDEATAMLSTLKAMGFDRIVATPHLMEPLSDAYHLQAIKAMNQISHIAAEVGIAMGLGYEHLLTGTLARRLKEGEPSTLAGSHAVLVELPFMHWPADTAHSLYTLRDAGYQPVLAHPERYLDAVSSPHLVTDAAVHGAVPQLTTGSFIGLYGADAQRLCRMLARDLLERDLPFILSSDGHSNGRRLTSVADGLAWIGSNMAYGQQIVEWATEVVPLELVSDAQPSSFRAWLRRERAEMTQPEPGTWDQNAEDLRAESDRPRGFSRLFRSRRG